MTILQLKYFVEVCRLQSFTKVAKQYHVSQPSVSITIKSLEKELSVILFKMSDNCLTMTRDAYVFYEKALDFLKHYDNLCNSMNKYNSERRYLRVGVSLIISPMIIPTIVKALKKKYPDVAISLYQRSTRETLDMLETGQLDVSITHSIEDTMSHYDLTVSNLTEIEYVFCIHKNLCNFNSTDILPEEIANIPLAVLNANLYTRAIYEMFDEYDIKPHVLYETTEIKTIETMVRMGLAATWLPRFFFMDYPDVKCYRLNGKAYGTKICAIWNNKNKFDILNCFIEEIKKFKQ